MTITVHVMPHRDGGFVARSSHWHIRPRARTRPAAAQLAYACIAGEALRRGLWRPGGGIAGVHVRFVVAETERERRRRLRRAN
jgi:hypothetical protein